MTSPVTVLPAMIPMNGALNVVCQEQPDRTPSTENIAQQMLTIRMLMSGKEVGSIIGKKGDNVKKYRLESGARINISDGSCPERIVTVTGTTDQIFVAFSMMCQKFEDDFTQNLQKSNEDIVCPPVTLRLLVPATQCGSIIGKGGCKIKDIRELTGASIQVASEVLPNSSERTVTISGTAKAISKCIKQLCQILLESPPKGATIPYRPKPALPPGVILPPGSQMPLSGTVSLPPEVSSAGDSFPNELIYTLTKSLNPSPLPGGGVPILSIPHAHSGPMPTPMFPENMILGPPMGMRPHGGPAAPAPTQTHEILIPNDLIGCIIGRGGNKINEIRGASGAQIKISNCEDGARERKITITGTPDTIQAAQYLINNSIELHKHLLALNVAMNSGPMVAPMPGSFPTGNFFGPGGIAPQAVMQMNQPPVPNMDHAQLRILMEQLGAAAHANLPQPIATMIPGSQANIGPPNQSPLTTKIKTNQMSVNGKKISPVTKYTPY